MFHLRNSRHNAGRVLRCKHNQPLEGEPGESEPMEATMSPREGGLLIAERSLRVGARQET
jgi:hypothetical protein